MFNIYTKNEAAKVLRISVESINRCMKNGKLPHRKIGKSVRFTESHLAAFMDACAVHAKEKKSA